MPKRVDPDDFTLKVNGSPTTEEVFIDTGAKTVQLRVAGNLDDAAPGKTSGATARAIYSFLKEEYLSGTDAAILRRYRFPLKMVFEGSFIWVNGWAPADDQTRDLFRDAGFLEQLTSAEHACMISLGPMNDSAADLAYYAQASGFTASVTDYDKTGELNENINITGNTTFKKSFLREANKTFAEYNLLKEYDISAITYQAYFFPLTNGTDLKWTDTPAFIDANTPYTGMELNYIKGIGFTTWANSTVYPAGAVVLDPIRQSNGSSNGTWWFTAAGGTSSGTGTADDVGVTWESYHGEQQIGTEWYAFNRILDCNGGTDVQAYSYLQRQLLLATNINADGVGLPANQGTFGAVNGNVAELFADYVGDDLILKGGVGLRNFDANSTNNIKHQPIPVDSGGLDAVTWTPIGTLSQVPYPVVAAGTLAFGANAVSQPDAQTWYAMYHAYITRTSGSYTLTASAGATGNFTWAGTDLDHIQAGDYLVLSGFSTNPANNGEYLVNSVGANTMNITHQDSGVTVVTETATVQVDENPFESLGAILVKDNSGTDITGQITSAGISFDFAYTNNNQGGRTPNTPAPVIVVAAALDGAEWTETSYTINSATGQTINVNFNDERNFVNPA